MVIVPLLFLAFVYDTVSSEYTSFSEEQKPLKISFITNVSKGHKLTGSSFMLKHKPDDRFQKGPFPLRADIVYAKTFAPACHIRSQHVLLPACQRDWRAYQIDCGSSFDYSITSLGRKMKKPNKIGVPLAPKLNGSLKDLS